MCFSAGASFVASAGLVVIGGASFKVAKKEERILAFIPIAFAIQQFFEGVQWISLGQGCTSLASGYGFLFFAYIFWPIYVPVAIYVLDKKRRKILKWLVALGVCIALFFLFLFLTEPLFIFSINQSIMYKLEVPFYYIAGILYASVIMLPLMVSSRHMLHTIALAVALAGLIATIFFFETFISVWCFFSAIASTLIYFYLKRKLPSI